MKETSESKPTETARYIGGMAQELRALAIKSDLGFLAYLLSMVEQEAETVARGKPATDGNHRPS